MGSISIQIVCILFKRLPSTCHILGFKNDDKLFLLQFLETLQHFWNSQISNQSIKKDIDLLLSYHISTIIYK